jgi:hypothetical protein
VVAVAVEDGDVIVCDGDVLGGEGGDAAFVAQVADTEQRVWLQVGKNVCIGCRCWQVWEVDGGCAGGDDRRAIRECNCDGLERVEWFTGWASIGHEKVACAASVGDGRGESRVGAGGKGRGTSNGRAKRRD